MGTMIPNPGMAQSGNSNIMATSSMDNSFVVGGGNSMMLSPVNTGNLIPNTTQISSGMQNGSLGSSDGGFMNGYQQSTSKFSSGNILISSMGAQRMGSQMMPTPGFNNTTEPEAASWWPEQSHIYYIALEAIWVRESGTSESYVTPSHYGNMNVHQQQMSQGDGYGSSITDSSRTGNFYVPTTSNTSMMNNKNMNPLSLHALHNTSAPLMVNQSNLVNTQQAEKMNFRSRHSLHETPMQSQQRVHFQQLVQNQSQ
ncbi:unnamed protein product [Lactuca saligna]|uniref:Uncharacterized protein n=1 Tax=Lactuca saligna TaxID=75948 RepID=A0AA35Z856_LACSI|nr:unnamed protein product [Lactuca saligna]